MSNPDEPFLTIKQVAALLGVAYWQLQRAVKRGDVPSYKPFNSRKLLRLSEVVAAIEAKRYRAAQ